MNILIDICHPAHVHFFKNAIKLLEANNHQVFVTSRDKDVTIDLLDKLNITHTCISKAPRKANFFYFFIELVIREYQLFKISFKFKPDIMTGIGGIFIAHVGFLMRIKSIAFYDTENATLQNLLTYPFLTKLIVPECYSSWTPKNTARYPGYHELSYLHKNYFTPNKNLAIQNGLDPTRNNYLLRIVSWQANHDICENGWSNEFLSRIISLISPHGNIIISTERKLPAEFQQFAYKGTTEMLHHVLAFCNLIIGESATLSSEAVVLGVPSIYVANTSRGYIDEQEKKYQLVNVLDSFDIKNIDYCIKNHFATDAELIRQRHEKLLQDTLDVTEYICEQIYNLYD